MTENAIDVKQLKKYAQEYSDAQLEKEAQADLQKSVIESASEALGIEKADFRQYADLYYKRTYQPEKFEKVEGMLDKVDVIRNL